jgi:hypothetical protein
MNYWLSWKVPKEFVWNAINSKCLFLVRESLLVFVRHKVLLPQEECRLWPRTRLEHGSPLTVHGFPHTSHVV